MVRRRDQHQRLRVSARDIQRRGKDRRGGIAPLGFDQDRLRRPFNLRQLFGHDEPERVASHHNRRGESGAGQTLGRNLEQAFIPHQLGKLFGVAFARQGPKTCARPAAKENSVHHEKQLI